MGNMKKIKSACGGKVEDSGKGKALEKMCDGGGHRTAVSGIDILFKSI